MLLTLEAEVRNIKYISKTALFSNMIVLQSINMVIVSLLSLRVAGCA